MPLEQENLFPQELTDLEIFAPSNTRITFKIAKCDVLTLTVIFTCHNSEVFVCN